MRIQQYVKLRADSKLTLIALTYLLFFLLVFLQFPLKNSLQGNSDTWYNLNIFCDYGNRIIAFFTGETLGNALYPESSVQIFAEPYLGEALTFLFFKLFQFSDLWAYYLFIVVTYATNGIAAFFLTKLYVKNAAAAFAAGWIFAASVFAFSQVELLNGLPYYFALLSIYFYQRYLWEKKLKLLIWCMVLGGLEIYFSAYIFVYQSLILGLVALFNWKLLWYDKKLLINSFAYLSIYLALIFPFAWLYVFNSSIKEAWNPMTMELMENFNLKPSDFFRSLNSNLLYAPIHNIEYGTLMKNANYANIGVAAYIVAIIGLFRPFRFKWLFIVIALLGLIFAFGPSIDFGTVKFRMPMWWVYEYTDLMDFIRIPARAFSLWILAIAVFAALGLEILMKKVKYPHLLLFAFVSFYLIENIPTSFHKYDSAAFLTPSQGFLTFFDAIDDNQTVIVNFPSSIFENRSNDQISEFGREYIYAYWQTKHKKNTVNGSSGFFPQSKLRNNELMLNITSGNNLEQLIELNGVDYVAFHNKMVLDSTELAQLTFFSDSQFLNQLFENQELVIFEVKKENQIE